MTVDGIKVKISSLEREKILSFSDDSILTAGNVLDIELPPTHSGSNLVRTRSCCQKNDLASYLVIDT